MQVFLVALVAHAATDTIKYLPNGVVDSSLYSAPTTALKLALLQNYDRTTAPPSAQVRYNLALQSFTSIDTSDQSMQFTGWWRHYWSDPRLRWNSSRFDVPMVTFRADEIWGPDGMVYEGFETTAIILGDPAKMDFSVYSDGSVFVSKPLVHKVRCGFDLSQFPFDTQRCKITLGSWSYNGLITDVKPRLIDGKEAPFDFEYYAEHDEFALMEVNTVSSTTYYSCCVEPYPIITFEFVLKRQSLTYVGGIVGPLIMVTVAGFMTFILNPSSGERVGLGMTVLLTNAAIYMVAIDSTPRTGSWTIVSVLYVVSSAGAVVTLLVSMLCVSLYCAKSYSQLTESILLRTFLGADANGDGRLDNTELKGAIEGLGLSEGQERGLRKIMHEQGLHKAESISFDDWFDVVLKLKQGGLAAHHNPLIRWALSASVRREWDHRRGLMIKKADKLVARRRRSSAVSKRPSFFPGSAQGLGLTKSCDVQTPAVESCDAQVPVVEWLNGVKVGFGAKFVACFDAVGLDDVVDLARIHSQSMSELKDRLVEAGAKTAHLEQIQVAMAALGARETPPADETSRILFGEGSGQSPVAHDSIALSLETIDLASATDPSNRAVWDGPTYETGGAAPGTPGKGEARDDWETENQPKAPPKVPFRGVDRHLDDPTEFVARRLAGRIDSVCFVLLPSLYFVFLAILFKDASEPCTVPCTKITHISLN
jgi:hypothetical protein